MIVELRPVYAYARCGAHIPVAATGDDAVKTVNDWLTAFTTYLMGEIGRRDVALRENGIDISEPFPL